MGGQYVIGDRERNTMGMSYAITWYEYVGPRNVVSIQANEM